MSESHTRIADEIFVADGRIIPYFTDAGITHGDIETYPEDWDAMVASLGPERTGEADWAARNLRFGSWQGGLRERAQERTSVCATGPTSLAERMDAERRNLERLGRNVAFWAIFGLAVTILSWWIVR